MTEIILWPGYAIRWIAANLDTRFVIAMPSRRRLDNFTRNEALCFVYGSSRFRCDRCTLKNVSRTNREFQLSVAPSASSLSLAEIKSTRDGYLPLSWLYIQRRRDSRSRAEVLLKILPYKRIIKCFAYLITWTKERQFFAPLARSAIINFNSKLKFQFIATGRWQEYWLSGERKSLARGTRSTLFEKPRVEINAELLGSSPAE